MLDKTMLVFGQMNEPPGARMRVALSGLTMAEYFRDHEGQDVLLFIDNIFRFVQAGSEVSALLGRMPSQVGYQPTLAVRDGRAAGADHLDPQRLGHVDPGDLRAGRRPHRPGAGIGVRAPELDDVAVAVDLGEGDLPGGRPARLDLDDPQGRDPRRRALRGRQPGQGGAAALQGAAGHHRDPRDRRAVRRGQGDRRSAPARSSASCRSRSSSPSSSPASPGKYVPVEESIRGFKEILEGKHDEVPESRVLHEGLDRRGRRGRRSARRSEAEEDSPAEEEAEAEDQADGRADGGESETTTGDE